MEITVCHIGTRYALEVFNFGDGDTFAVVRIEPFDHSPTVHELVCDLIKTQGEVEKLARVEVAKRRAAQQIEEQEERAA